MSKFALRRDLAPHYLQNGEVPIGEPVWVHDPAHAWKGNALKATETQNYLQRNHAVYTEVVPA